MLDYAKFFEFIGETQRSRKILEGTRKVIKSDWKVFFESVLTEIRNNSIAGALEMVNEALKLHFATGRLWATLIQLQHSFANDPESFTLPY